MQLLGARYYLPALGRFLTQDPIGHQDRLNLYAYCENNPLSRVDPTGLQGEQDNSWGRALSFLWDFISGTGSDKRLYNDSSSETMELMESRGGQQLLQQLSKQLARGRRDNLGGSVGTVAAAWNTFLEPGNGIQAQLGAFSWSGVYNTRSGNVDITINNKAGMNSFLYHASDGFGSLADILGSFSPFYDGSSHNNLDFDRGGNVQPLGNIYQTFKVSVTASEVLRRYK